MPPSWPDRFLDYEFDWDKLAEWIVSPALGMTFRGEAIPLPDPDVYDRSLVYVREHLETEARTLISDALFVLQLRLLLADGCLFGLQPVNYDDPAGERFVQRQKTDAKKFIALMTARWIDLRVGRPPTWPANAVETRRRLEEAMAQIKAANPSMKRNERMDLLAKKFTMSVSAIDRALYPRTRTGKRKRAAKR